MHVYCIPYALMKQNPLQWLNIITKNKGESLATVGRTKLAHACTAETQPCVQIYFTSNCDEVFPW